METTRNNSTQALTSNRAVAQQQEAMAVFKNPAKLAEIRTDPDRYPHYRNIAEKQRGKWLSTQLLTLAGLMRIKDYTIDDARMAATALDGQIMGHQFISDYTLVEIADAFRSGIFGELGEWKGLTVQSLWGFLVRSLSLPVRREAINAIYARRQAEKAHAEQEAIRAEIEKAKADGTFTPTGRIEAVVRKPAYEPSAEDLAHRERVRAQAAEILARAGANNTHSGNKIDINW